MGAAFCGIDGSDQNPFDFKAVLQQRIAHFIINISRHMQQFEPIFRFGGFFQSNVHFGNEISLALTVICFIYVGTDACPATDNLLGNNDFLFGFQKMLMQFYNSCGKSNGFINQQIFFHTNRLFDIRILHYSLKIPPATVGGISSRRLLHSAFGNLHYSLFISEATSLFIIH